MRIALVLATSAGGTGRHVAELACGLVAAGHDVVVAAPAQEAQHFAFSECGAEVVTVDISDRPSPGDARAIATLRQVASRVDVMHAHGTRVAALCVIALRGTQVPLVTTVHNSAPSGRVTSIVHAGLERLTSKGSAMVLGVSQDLVDRQKAIGAKQTGLAVIAAAAPRPAVHDRYAVRRKLGIASRTALIVTVARLAPQKDLDLLIHATAQLRAHSDLDVLAVIAGEGPLRGSLEKLIASTGAPVRLLGQRSDIPDLIAAADVVVSSSRWEGQPVALQEALHAGSAIVATDAGGTGHVVGDAAILTRVGDIASLTSALRDVLQHGSVRDDLRSKAMERAAELPDQQQATAAALTAYETVVTNNHR